MEEKNHVREVWADRSKELAQFTADQLVNRWDAFGYYDRDGNNLTAKHLLTLGHLTRHYATQGARIGLHAIDPKTNTSRFGAWDIDAHKSDPATVWPFTWALTRHLDCLGANPVTEHSGGGHKVWVRFSSPVPGHQLRAWMTDVTAEVRDEWGDQTEAEIYPKQDTVAADKWGSWVRLPGKHHKRDHISKFWDGGTWTAFPDLWLTTPASDPDLVLGHVPAPRPEPTLRPGRHKSEIYTGPTKDHGWLATYRGDLRTLDLVRLFTEAGMVKRQLAADRWDITCPWVDDHSTGDNGTCLWQRPGDYPVFCCCHAHCQGRKLRDVLEWVGKPVVEEYCGAKFDSLTEKLNRMMADMKQRRRDVEASRRRELYGF